MNGVDVSWAVIDGDFGLARPGLMTPTVVYRLAPIIIPNPPVAGARYEPGYFPRTGKEPGYGRLEVEPAPDRPLPPPAQSYRKSWSSQSAPGPVTDYPPFLAPPIGITVDPMGDRHDHDHDHDNHSQNDDHTQDHSHGHH